MLRYKHFALVLEEKGRAGAKQAIEWLRAGVDGSNDICARLIVGGRKIFCRAAVMVTPVLSCAVARPSTRWRKSQPVYFGSHGEGLSGGGPAERLGQGLVEVCDEAFYFGLQIVL